MDAVTVTDLVVDRGQPARAARPVASPSPPGQVTGLLGPSGSGKTTLMRALVGVQVVRSGEVTVLGEPAGSPALRSRVGYVTQAPSVYEDLTVRENVRYFAVAVRHGRARGRRRDRRRRAWPTPPASWSRDLSGGQQGRASLACALVGSPEVLVLDEPTVGLDPVLRVELWDRFHALAARRDDADRLQPRDGRGRPLRPAAAAPRRRAARRLHAGAAARRRPLRRPRGGLPQRGPRP